MKKAILLLLMCIAYKNGYTQINKHFCDIPGIAIPNPPSFDGSPGNWQRSHGTPSWSTSTIYMWHSLNYGGGGAAIGEGIYQDNVFPVPGYYKVKIGLKQAPFHGRIRIWATKGLTPYTGFFAGTAIPSTAPPITANWIGDWTLGFTSATTVDIIVDPSFYNTLTNGQIWIYPEQTVAIGAQVDCIIDYVQVCLLEPGVTYSSGTLPGGESYKDFFKIGSSFPGGSGVVVNDNTVSTDYIARSYLDISSNTDINADPYGFFFIGEIGYPCTEAPAESCGGHSKFSGPKDNNVVYGDSTVERLLQANNTNINIYPKPSNGTFTIAFSTYVDCEIHIINTLGVTVYKAVVSNANSHKVKLDEQLPAGTYVVEIKNKDINYTDKIFISR